VILLQPAMVPDADTCSELLDDGLHGLLAACDLVVTTDLVNVTRADQRLD
jgi:hypothetical protein